MLDATKDGNDERPAKEGFPEAIKADVGNRMVYKLVKVGDDGSVLAAIEDEVFQSLIGRSNNGLSSFDPEGSDVIEDDEDEEESGYLASDGDNLNRRANIIPIQDLAIERQKLKAQIEVLDCILMRVDLEEQRKLSTEKDIDKSIGCHVVNSSTYFNGGEGCGDYKRQRRPNPKYFDYNIGDDSLMGPPLSSTCGESLPTPQSLRKPPRNAVGVSPRTTSGWNSHHSSDCAATSHRAKATISQKPFTQTLSKVASTCPSSHCMSIVSKEDNTILLDNLSIRELHEAFCSTYGRETSVKDKHWLKRQISAGWMRKHDVVIKSSSQHQVQNKLKARLDCVTQAQQPLLTTAPINVGDIERDAANETHVQRTNEVESFRDAFRIKLGNKCFQRKMTTPTILFKDSSFGILTTGSLNESSAASGQTTISGEVVNNGEVVEGKRKRKPNRRYIEDEVHIASGFVPILDTRSFHGATKGVKLNSTTNYSWKTVETNGSSGMIGRHGTIRGSTMQNVSNKKFLPIQRPKLISSGMKRKVGGKAAKLVKMAHSTSQTTRQDVEVAICKAKFQLPATPEINTSDKTKMNGEVGDQASNLLSVVQFDPLIVVQPMILDSRGENEEKIITVPTANGKTRRKHHRPWTLREVMTLVEGVARCGGGKWADIKKLAFSSVEYRTTVDLKDKWRNLLRASRAQQHPAKQGERKKQFTAAIPAPILARVRKLASHPNQIPSSTIFVSSTSRSGRIVHRK